MQTIQNATSDATAIASTIVAADASTADALQGAPTCVLCAAPHDGPTGGLCRPCFSLHVGERQPQHNPTKAHVRRNPILLTDSDGSEIALIPTNKAGMTVKMLATDLRDIVARGFTDQVTIARDSKSGFYYATINVTGVLGGTVQLSRLIVGAGRRKSVKYADGDRLNLRRENLVVVKGCGKNIVQVANRIKAVASLATTAVERPEKVAIVEDGLSGCP